METPPIFPLLFSLSPLWFCFGCGLLFFQGLAARGRIGGDWRISWAFTVLFMACLCVGITECAAAARLLARGVVLGAWLAADAALLVAVVRLRQPAPGKIMAGLREALRRPFANASGWPRWNKALLAMAAALVLLAGLVALQCPTNVWDSLTYHAPRVMHWLQQRSLAHYPTNILRQVESAPGAELQISTLVLLAGNDWPMNLPEWWALVNCALLAGFMAEQLLAWHFGKAPLDAGRVRFCGLLAALIVITDRQSLTQAISAQNDLLSSQWMLLLAVFGLLLAREPGNRFYAGGVAAAFALGVNNKLTMFIYAAPFAAALGIWLLRKSPRALWTLGVAAAVFFLALNLPWMTRNYRIFHSPLASQATRQMQTLKNHAPAKMAANLVRNLGLYSGSTFAPATSALNRLQLGLIGALGEPPQDPGSVWKYSTFHLPVKMGIHEGEGFGAVMAVLPPLLAAVFFLLKFQWKSPAAAYPLLIFAGFAIFSGYLKWQPWHERLHLPFFILAAPFAGMVLGWAWSRRGALTFALVLAAHALIVLGWNGSFSVCRLPREWSKTREERYFDGRSELYPSTSELARDLVRSGVTNVLLKIGVDTWEYPLWVCLGNRGFQGTIQHAFVDNESGPLGSPNLDFPATAILSQDAAPPPLPDFPLTVAYDTWSVHFRGKPENRLKLISNRMQTNILVQQPGRLEIRCDVIDQDSRPVTNNILRLRAADFTRDFPLAASSPMVLECPLKAGTNKMTISLVNPPTAEQRIVTLANFTTKFQPP
jgi:hypothetical protein